MFKNLSVLSEVYLHIVVIRDGLPSNNGQWAESVGYAVLGWELVEYGDGAAYKFYNHDFWKAFEW